MSDPAGSDRLELILTRRSAGRLSEPGPTEAQFEALIAAATSVPDHGRLRPWRFVVISGTARDRFADALEKGAAEADPSSPPERLAKARSKAYAAPAAIAIIASPQSGTKVPEWEQVASAACAGYAITLAAHALDLGAMWKSAAFVDAPAVRACFELEPSEQLLGWINLGQTADTGEPSRPALETRPDLCTYLPG